MRVISVNDENRSAQSARTSWLRPWRAHIAVSAMLVGGVALVGWSQCLPPDDVDPAKFVEISEGISVDIYTAGILTHRIESERGLMQEETRNVWMERPRVQIFENGEAARVVTGEQGRLWPVNIQTPKEDGTVEEVTKFDWQICGGVTFHSADGQSVETPELKFDNGSRMIRGDKGVKFELPAGKEGEIALGNAVGFEVAVDTQAGGLGEWKLIGPGELRFEKGKTTP
jgi:hypothetical protein